MIYIRARFTIITAILKDMREMAIEGRSKALLRMRERRLWMCREFA